MLDLGELSGSYDDSGAVSMVPGSGHTTHQAPEHRSTGPGHCPHFSQLYQGLLYL